MKLKNACYFMHISPSDTKEILNRDYVIKCNAAMMNGIFVRNTLEYRGQVKTLRKFLDEMESEGIKNVIIHDVLTLLDEDIMRHFIKKQFNIVLVNLYLDKGYCAVSERIPTDFYDLNKDSFNDIEKIETYKRIITEEKVDKRLRKNILKLLKYFENQELKIS